MSDTPNGVIPTVAEEWDGRLSYSSFTKLMDCPRKYAHYKVTKTPKDDDVEEDTHALRFGKAFHQLLEDTLHDIRKLTKPILNQAVTDHDLLEEDEGDVNSARLVAMFRNYARVRGQTNFKVVVCEFEIATPIFYGFVDVVLEDNETGDWWIGDVKTASSQSKLLEPSLPSDWQLNLYAYHAREIAATFKLPLEKFKGCRYMNCTKPKLVKKRGENWQEYMKRCEGSCTYNEFVIPVGLLFPQDTYDQFKMAHAKAKALHKMKGKTLEKAAPKNLKQCSSFFKPCEYWSKCHGSKVTEMTLEVFSSEKC